MSAAGAININRPSINAWSIGEKVFKNFDKDILKTIRTICEIAKFFFEDFEVLFPVNPLITLVKTTEDGHAITDFGKSLCKSAKILTSDGNNSQETNVDKFYETNLDLTWNFYKICKNLKKYNVVSYASKHGKKLFSYMKVIGPIAFAILSCERINNSRNDLNILDEQLKENLNKPLENRTINLTKHEATKKFHKLSIVKNIATLGIAIILALKGMFAMTFPGMTLVVLGAFVLTSKAAAFIIKESNGLELPLN